MTKITTVSEIQQAIDELKNNDFMTVEGQFRIGEWQKQIIRLSEALVKAIEKQQ